MLQPVLDLMQTLPTFVYLIPAIVFFGIGMVPGLIATVIFVLPAPIRLTYLGVASTPNNLLEAAEAFGATGRQRLLKVELPYALPQIMAGLNQTIMLSLSMVVVAALVGANGLGVPVVRALDQVNTALGFESGFIIVVVAIMLDRMLRIQGSANERRCHFRQCEHRLRRTSRGGAAADGQGREPCRNPEGDRPDPRRAQLLADRGSRAKSWC